jgi:rhomboid family protein
LIPLRDKNPTRTVPVLNIALIVLNVIVFLYQLSLGSGVEELYYRFGVIPHNVSASFAQGSIVAAALPLFSSMFLHGGFLHLGGNMLYLWIFGDNVEDKLGHGRYLVFYLLCGLISALAHVVSDPGSMTPTIGASGAISGVLGAYLLMFPRARVITIIPVFVFLQIAELPAFVVLGFWFIMQFLYGLVSLGSQTVDSGGIAWWAHVGGFAAGLALVTPFRRIGRISP